MWSRERPCGSRSATSTPPASPASRSALLICALETGSSYVSGGSGPPRTVSGSPSPACSVKRAPIRASGTVTRRIGRRRSEASPVSVAAKRCPASRPSSSRVVVPELPQSRVAPAGAGGHGPTTDDDARGAERRDLGAELAQHPGAAPRIERGQRAAHVTLSPGQRGEQQRAMGDALVARDADGAAHDHRSSPWRKRCAAAR